MHAFDAKILHRPVKVYFVTIVPAFVCLTCLTGLNDIFCDFTTKIAYVLHATVA